MTYPTCPVDLRGDRAYYRKAIAAAAARIKATYGNLAAAELVNRPELSHNPRWRRTARCSAADVRRNLGQGFFAIHPRPGHTAADVQAWVNAIAGGLHD